MVDLTQKVPDSVQRSLLADSPDLVIATPGRAALSISTSAFPTDSLSLLVIDEADLVLSYGYEDDLQNVAKSIPNGVQTMLVSATLTTEVDTIKNLYCRDPVILDVDDHVESKDDISQYVVKYVYLVRLLQPRNADMQTDVLRMKNFSWPSSSSS